MLPNQGNTNYLHGKIFLVMISLMLPACYLFLLVKMKLVALLVFYHTQMIKVDKHSVQIDCQTELVQTPKIVVVENETKKVSHVCKISVFFII